MLKGIHHVSINVTDVEQAVDFYTNVLGLTLLPRPDLGFPGAWLGSGAQEVHLLGIESTPPPKEQHFAFEVADLAQVQQKLASHNVDCSAAAEMQGICLQSFAHDPSGNLLEFNQRLS